MGEHDLRVGEQFTVQECLGVDDSPFAPQVGQRDFVDKLIARTSHPVKLGAGDLGEDDFLREPTRLADQDPPRLCQALDDQRGRHHRITGEVIVEVLFRQGEILDRTGELAAAKLQKLIDPDPSHRLVHPPQEPESRGTPRPTTMGPAAGRLQFRPTTFRRQAPSTRTVPSQLPTRNGK